VESGEVVEIEGDCYGDAVNTAARLADLAGAEQILTTQRVCDALEGQLRQQLRSIGPMYLRGKSEATDVYRVQWQAERDTDATMMGTSMFKPIPEAHLQVSAGGQSRRLGPHGEPLTLGRAPDASLTIKDSRVSRVHATIEWRGGHFILNDQSSFGTWVYVGGQTAPIVLRRTECYLVGNGLITLGCGRDAERAPQVEFNVLT
jgi:adenylate cyclase